MNPFEPVGAQARWKAVYCEFQKAGVGDVVTYETLADALELHSEDDRHAIQMAARRAAKEYLQEDSRAVEAVKNVGYRVVEPKEHLRLAQDQQRRSNKALKRGHSTVVHVDLNGMEPAVRQAFDVTARAFSTLLEYNRRLDTKQQHLAKALDSIATRQDRSDEEIQQLKERLAKIEASRNKKTG